MVETQSEEQDLSARDIVTQLNESNLKVIELELGSPKNYWWTKGTLESYINSVKNIGNSVVFLQEYELVNEDLIYKIDGRLFGEYGDSIISTDKNEKRINLANLHPEIGVYKDYLGKTCLIRLFSIFESNNILAYEYKLPWYVSLEALVQEKIAQFELQEQILQEQAENTISIELAEIEKKRNHLLEKLKLLTNDPKLAKCKTQRAMQAYAIEKIPELADLDSDLLKTEIQHLADKLKAKELLMK